MKKLFAIVVLVALLFSVSIAEASFGYKKDGADEGQATDLNIQGGYSTFDGSTVTLYSSGYAGGVTANVSTESTLTSAALAYGIINMTPGSAKTIGLDDGTAGQMVTIIMNSDSGGNIVISKTSFPVTTHSTGWNTLTFADALDSVTLLYVDDTIGWVVFGNSGVAVA